ncbi:MAG: hypothetical protein GTN80_03220, partial [Nitrososphaeria archaeon]|nr:hypothetical protein [Nitrososphaeria archaeon]NIN52191.1 hypothetical protein [Nitrososphaeria archaeon]NIQ32644.1 hypothetical protein [Nitrososphaeria archaeon]
MSSILSKPMRTRMGMKESGRGVGTLIGASFIILILLAGFGAYMFMTEQWNSYMESVMEIETLDYERKQENAYFTNGRALTEDNHLNVSLMNRGAIEIQIIYVGVFDYFGDDANCTYYSVEPLLVMPGTSETNIGTDILLSDPTQTYEIRLVSHRGTIFTGELRNGNITDSNSGPRGPPGPPGPAGGTTNETQNTFGPFQLHFDTWRFYY